MTICLDTNAVIAVINKRPVTVQGRFERAVAAGEATALSVFVLFELRYGIAKSDNRDRSAAALERFLSFGIEVWPFDCEDAEEAGEIRASLARVGTPIGPYDILIAAQARRRGAVLVTANTREFERVPGLRLENWLGS